MNTIVKYAAVSIPVRTVPATAPKMFELFSQRKIFTPLRNGLMAFFIRCVGLESPPPEFAYASMI